MTICTQNDDSVLEELSTPSRNRYFYGKLMDVHHFQMEQNYFNRKRWLLNRLSHGSGVLYGLAVVPTNDGSRVTISPGMAIDHLGREIIVPSVSPPVDPRQLSGPCGGPGGKRIDQAGKVSICLAYHECQAELVPVLVGDCDSQNGCASSTICERYEVLVQEGGSAPIQQSCSFPGLFKKPGRGRVISLGEQVHEQLVKASLTDSVKPAEASIALAQIDLPVRGGKITENMITQAVRPLAYSNERLFELLLCLAEQSGTSQQGPKGDPAVPGAPGIGLDPTLTKVTTITWPHDGEFSFDQFMDKGLAVIFNNDVHTNVDGSHGQAWFIVTVEYPMGDNAGGYPYFPPGTTLVQRVLGKRIGVDQRTAFFEPYGDFKETFEKTLDTLGLDWAFCRVVLKCDFLLDEQNRPVDGDHLGGNLPSGNGVKGGNFESWFILKK